MRNHCKKHGYEFVTMPRLNDPDEPTRYKDVLYARKCPLASCKEGIFRPRTDVVYEGSAGEMRRVEAKS